MVYVKKRARPDMLLSFFRTRYIVSLRRSLTLKIVSFVTGAARQWILAPDISCVLKEFILKVVADALLGEDVITVFLYEL